MTKRYALIDTANTFFRARHVASRGATSEEKVASALHITLASVNQAVRRYGIDHTVFCLEGRSFRKDIYLPYKKNRVVDAMSVTEAEIRVIKSFTQSGFSQDYEVVGVKGSKVVEVIEATPTKNTQTAKKKDEEVIVD